MKYILIWAVAASTINGSGIVRSIEQQRFETQEECVTFGKTHMARMADWSRGYLGLDWHARILVVFRCEPEEKPA